MPQMTADVVFDDRETILLVRQSIFVEKEIQAREISSLTIRFAYLTERIAQAEAMLDFFTGTLIPPDHLCLLSPEFFRVELPEAPDQKCLQYLRRFAARIEERVATAREARPSSFEAHFMGLVQSAEVGQDYIPQSEAENMLGQYYFCSRSQCIKGLDRRLLQMRDFSEGIMELCVELLPGNLTQAHQSVGLVLLFRTLFHRPGKIRRSGWRFCSKGEEFG
jgi:hypothetical protein